MIPIIIDTKMANYHQHILTQTRLEEERICALPCGRRTQSEQTILYRLDKYLENEVAKNSEVYFDAIFPPYQYPPGCAISINILPIYYIYYVEYHLNWMTVYTVVNYIMEIVGVNHGVNLETTPPTTSLYRDGKCKRAYCYATNFLILDQNCPNLKKFLKLSESKRDRSHKAYGTVAIISEDKYGRLVNFGEKVSDDKSELDPMVIYPRQLGVSTSCPID